MTNMGVVSSVQLQRRAGTTCSCGEALSAATDARLINPMPVCLNWWTAAPCSVWLGPFAATVSALAANVRCLGGCCGTAPTHIRMLADLAADRFVPRPKGENRPCLVVTSRSDVEFGSIDPVIIGERINPTGKADLTAELQRLKPVAS